MRYPKIQLDGAVVAIAGGARGIGKATTDLFTAKGARVCVGDLDGAESALDVNVWGLIHGMRLVMPHMIERGSGHVVNVASMAGKLVVTGMAVHNASKFAAVGLSSAVRQEYLDSGVSVTAALPSAVRTRLASGVPLGYGLPTVDPEDVARAIVGSVDNRHAEITVPRYLAGWHLLNAAVPEPLMQLGRSLIGDRQALMSVSHEVRAAYESGSEPRRRDD